MQRNPQLWITTGIALVGASLVAVTPVTAPRPDVQHRQFRLTDYDEFDLSQLTTTTEANWSGLETVLSSSNWLTDPDISQGLSTVLSDLSTGTSNPVTNPISLLTEGALLLTSSGDAANAASTALTAVTDNVESALSSGDYSTALTDLENGPTTLLDAYLNGYPETVGSGLISPEFGLLTNTTDGAATGEIDALQQVSNTIADEVSAVGGGDLTTTPTLVDPGSLDLSVNVSTILNDLAPSGTVTLPFSLDSLLSDAAPSGTLTLPVTLDQLLSDAAPNGTLTLPVTLDQLLAGATPGGTVTLPISLDGLLIDAAGSSGDITIPITPDQVLGDALGNGGSLSVSLNEESILGDIAPNGITISQSFPIIGTQHISVPLSTIESALGLNSSSAINVSIPDSTVLSDLESALGSSGNQDITVPVSDLESVLGTAGSQDISVSTSTLESLLGTSGSQDVSVPLSTLESILPSTLNLDLTIPEVTGGAVPTYDVDLAHDVLAVFGSIAPVSSDLPSLLGTDPTLDVTSLLSSALTDLGLPVAITGGDLTANLTGIASELLAGLVP
jgi:hypothetical protein